MGGVTTEEAFRDLGLGGFEVATANGGKAELPISGGASREITLGNRLVFVDMVEAYKIREFWAPVRGKNSALWLAHPSIVPSRGRDLPRRGHAAVKKNGARWQTLVSRPFLVFNAAHVGHILGQDGRPEFPLQSAHFTSFEVASFD